MTGGRVALTTGANSGIGLATTLELARRGMRSVGTVRSRAKARIVHDAADTAGLTVETAVLDVTDPDSCARVIRRYRPTVLVNNAGYSVTGAVEDVGDDEARAILAKARRAAGADATLVLLEQVVPVTIAATPEHQAVIRADLDAERSTR